MVPGTGSGTPFLIPTSRYQGFGARFSGGYLHFSFFFSLYSAIIWGRENLFVVIKT